MSSGPQINGSSIRGALKYVKEHHPGGIPALLALLPPDSKDAFARPILGGAWYPYETYAALLRLIDDELGTGDFESMRDLGRFTAGNDVGAAFKFVRIFSSIEKLAPKAHTFWPRHCTAGTFEVLEQGSHLNRVALHDFPTIDPRHCLHLCGWLEAMSLKAGAKTAVAEHPRCATKGADCCEFVVRWTD